MVYSKGSGCTHFCEDKQCFVNLNRNNQVLLTISVIPFVAIESIDTDNCVDAFFYYH